MKHIINIFGCLLLGGAALVACQQKEVAGPAPVGDINVNPGYLRAEVSFAAPSDAKTARVFFNSGKYADYDVNAAEATQKMIIEDLDEGDQTLHVITFNADGVKSNPKGFQTHIYGPKYVASLSNRTLIDQAVLGNSSLEVYLGDACKDESELRFVYTNTEGKKDSIIVAPNVTTISVDDIDFSKIYYFYTVCVPSENCIDEFTTTMVDAQKGAKKIFNKMLWTAEGADGLIDDDASTFWQASSDALPVSVTIDMSSDKVFNQFIINQAVGGTGSIAKRVTVEASSDGSSWTPVLTDKKLALNAYCQTYPVTETTARYLKVTVTEAAGEGAVKIAEIDLGNDSRNSGENGIAMPELKNPGPIVTVTDKVVGGPNFATRFFQMTDWIHTMDLPTADNSSGSNQICFFSAAPWGVGDATNAKVYQTLQLLPGKYQFSVAISASGDCYTDYWVGHLVVAKGDSLPDQWDLSPALAFNQILAAGSTLALDFTLTEAASVSLGVVYTTYSTKRWDDTQAYPWAQQYLESFSFKVYDAE